MAESKPLLLLKCPGKSDLERVSYFAPYWPFPIILHWPGSMCFESSRQPSIAGVYISTPTRLPAQKCVLNWWHACLESMTYTLIIAYLVLYDILPYHDVDWFKRNRVVPDRRNTPNYTFDIPFLISIGHWEAIYFLFFIIWVFFTEWTMFHTYFHTSPRY